MGSDAESSRRLPVPMPAYGPLRMLPDHAYELSQTSRPQEALVAVDAYEPFARAFGDEKTVGFLLQARMYAYLNLGRLPEALAAGEGGGNVCSESGCSVRRASGRSRSRPAGWRRALLASA